MKKAKLTPEVVVNVHAAQTTTSVKAQSKSKVEEGIRGKLSSSFETLFPAAV